MITKTGNRNKDVDPHLSDLPQNFNFIYGLS